MEKQKAKMEGMIGQWRDYLKCTIDEMNAELTHKDIQIARLKIALEKNKD